MDNSAESQPSIRAPARRMSRAAGEVDTSYRFSTAPRCNEQSHSDLKGSTRTEQPCAGPLGVINEQASVPPLLKLSAVLYKFRGSPEMRIGWVSCCRCSRKQRRRSGANAPAERQLNPISPADASV